jgi:hypothetical protein
MRKGGVTRTVLFGALCEKCGQGTMSEVIRLTEEERIKERCGRYLLVRCTNAGCRARSYARRNHEEEDALEAANTGLRADVMAPGRCGKCGVAHYGELCWRRR